jgi:MFS family permease
MTIDALRTAVEQAPPAPPVRQPQRLLARPYRALTIGAVALISLTAFEALAVTTAMPTVAQELNGLGLYALAFGGPLAAGVVGMVVSGIWSDARGPAQPLWHGVAWFAGGLVIAGTAPAMGLVVAGRAVQGLGSGLLSVALYVVVGRVYPAPLRPRILAAFAGAWVVPSMVGPALAGLTVQYVDWRWVFLAVPVLTVPAALLIRPGLRGVAKSADDWVATPADDMPRTPGVTRRVAWAGGAAASAALLHYGGQQRGLSGAALVAAALVGLAVSAPKLLPGGFLVARRGMPAVVALRGLAAAAFVGAEVFIPLLLSRERGLSPAQAGLALTVGAVAWATGSWYQGRRDEPGTRTARLRTALLLIAAGIGSVALTVSASVPTLVAILGWGAAGLGMGIAFPLLTVLMLELSPPREQGRNSAALQLGDSLSSATVLALGGTLFAATADPGPATYLAGFGIAAAVAFTGAAIAHRATTRIG